MIYKENVQEKVAITIIYSINFNCEYRSRYKMLCKSCIHQLPHPHVNVLNYYV